jgi:hypothetical protein
MSPALRYIAMYLVFVCAMPAWAADGGASPDAGARAQPQSFTAEAPPAAHFGEPFPYTIQITHPAGEVYALPRSPELGEFDLVATEKHDAPSGEKVVTRFDLQLRAWTLGKKALPELSLEVQTAQGPTRLAIPGPTVDVVGEIPDGGEAELRDIAPPVQLPVRTYRLLVALAVGLAVFALAFFVARQLRRPKPVVVAPVVPIEPLEVRTRRALEALLAEDLAGQGRHRELYFRLSELVRRYLGERFGFDAIDLTTEELLTALRKRPTPGLDLPAFARSSLDADLVKFAKLQPDANACKASIDEALALVESSTRAVRTLPERPR